MARNTTAPVQLFRGTTAQHNVYTGAEGELTVDTTKKTVVVQDGTTVGGHPLAKAATTITATNGVQVTAGGTLGENTAIAGMDASATAKGVVQLSSATDSTSEALAATPKAVSDALTEAKTYADTAGNYTGAAPIAVDASTHVITAADATASSKGVVQVGGNINVSGGTISVPDASASTKGVVQVGTNLDVANGVVSVKPWATYAADHSSVNVNALQDGAIVQTDEALGTPLAVLADVETTLSTSADRVPTSAAVYYGKYDLCEFYYFRNPTLRPGFVEAAGGLITDAATRYPRAFAYLQTSEGQQLCKTEAEWQALSTAIYYTNAADVSEGWNGVGGVPWFVIDTAAGTIRVPDVRGMYMEAAGLDGLTVGGVHADSVRDVTNASLTSRNATTSSSTGIVAGSRNLTGYGAFYNENTAGIEHSNVPFANSSSTTHSYTYLRLARTMPCGNYAKPRAFGTLASVYLGA